MSRFLGVLSMRRSILFFAGGFVLLVAVCMAVFFYMVQKNMPRPDPAHSNPAAAQQAGDGQTLENTPAPGDPEEPAKTNPEPPRNDTPAETNEKVAERDRILEAVAKPWQDAMDDNDENAILKESLTLSMHPEPEIRAKAVEGLRWIGPKGIVGLANMMYDRDREIAKDAAEGWLDELREMDDDDMKAALLELATQNVDALDEDTLNDVLSLFEDLPEHLAATKLLEILKGSNKPDYIETILDSLGFIIQPDEPFEDKAKAIEEIEAWLKDPENFDKPEDKDDE